MFAIAKFLVSCVGLNTLDSDLGFAEKATKRILSTLNNNKKHLKCTESKLLLLYSDRNVR